MHWQLVESIMLNAGNADGSKSLLITVHFLSIIFRHASNRTALPGSENIESSTCASLSSNMRIYAEATLEIIMREQSESKVIPNSRP